MADSGRAVEVHGAVATGSGAATGRTEVDSRTAGGKPALDGHVASEKPEALVAQIDRTREDLARTIDTLVERVNPGHNARLLRERALEQAKRPEVQLAAAAVGLAVVGLVILRVWGKRRRH
jgi:Protein of unknown function (DUF3618)